MKLKKSKLFQFHKGTIRTQSRKPGISVGTEFQFHKGTIRTGAGAESNYYVSGFQFHKGTIRTMRTSVFNTSNSDISIP